MAGPSPDNFPHAMSTKPGYCTNKYALIKQQFFFVITIAM